MSISLRIPPQYLAGDRVLLPCHRTPGRYTMPIPLAVLSDEAAALLVYRELNEGWERAERDLLDEVLGPGSVFLDVGAHWGIHSLHAATAGADVVAVEPDPDNRAMLSAWLAANGSQRRVTVVDAAVSDRPGTAYLRRNTSMGHSLVFDPADPAVRYARGPFAGRAVYVPTRVLRLDDVPLPPDGPVVVKVDVEGGEPQVLRGATGLLASGRVTHVIWERNGGNEAVDGILAGFGFRSTPLSASNVLSVRV